MRSYQIVMNTGEISTFEANARNSVAKYFIIFFKIDTQENKKYITCRYIKLRLRLK